MSMENDAVAETPYALAKRLHSLGAQTTEVERALRALGLDADEARIAARAGRGEAGMSPLADRVPAQSELPGGPPTEAPKHPCPLHSEWPVLATCSRCGKFICARCVSEGGLLALPVSRQCPTCEARFPVAQGIGGWLVLPALHLCAVAPLTAGAGIVQDLVVLPRLTGAVIAPVLVELLFNASFLAFAIYTAIAFFRRKRRAVTLMILFYVAVMGSAVLGIALSAWVASLNGNQGGAEESVVQSGRAFISGVVWIAYFLQSKRVKATFVVP